MTKTALVVGACVVALCVFEITLRLAAPLHLAGDIRQYEFDEELGVRAKPGARFSAMTDYRQEYAVTAMGTNGFTDAVSTDAIRVFAMGDSYTQGLGVPPDASYPFQLDLGLNTVGGGYSGRYAVLNLGVSGYGLKQSLILAERVADRLGSPAFLLFLGAANDLVDDQLFENGYRHGHLVDGGPGWFGFAGTVGRLAQEIEILKRAKLVLGRWRRGGIVPTPATKATREDVGEPIPSRMSATYGELKALAERKGAKLIVSWAACREDAVDADYEWLRAWAKRNAVGFADWCGDVRRTVASHPALTIGNDHSAGHFRVWVNRLIADAFQREIVTAPRPG